MKPKKNFLRFGTILCVLLCFLLPLLSSPVAAAVTATVDAITENKPNGPTANTVTGWPGTNIAAGDDGTGTLTVFCDCFMKDSNKQGIGSYHYIELNVQQSTGGPVYGTSLSALLRPGKKIKPYPTTISVNVPYIPGPPIETFIVWVYAECTDNSTSTRVMSGWMCTVTT